MNTPQTDRRVRRTKALLLKGLMRLMETKDIKDISVKELSDLVDINRSTFYLHYNDIYDMLDQIENELFVEFNDILDRTIGQSFEPVSAQATLKEIFSFLDRHRDVARTIMGPHGDLTFVNRMNNLVKERIRNLLNSNQPHSDYTYIEAFVVSGCIGVIETWLNHPNPQTPEEISTMCSTLLTKGSFLL